MQENFLNRVRNIVLRSGKSKIAIIGKGASLTEIDKAVLHDFFIININDTETLVPGSLAMFFREDVYENCQANNFADEAYFAPEKYSIPSEKHFKLPYEALNADSIDHVFDYLQHPQFYIVDFLALSAIKFSLIYQQILGKPIEVFLLGFDFQASQTTQQDDALMYDLEYKNVLLKTQESLFHLVLNHFTEIYEQVQVYHIGDKPYSKHTTATFNSFFKDKVAVSTHKLSNSAMYRSLMEKVNEGRTIIVAEFTNNHIGDPKRISKMIELAKENGADMVKFQKRDVNTFYTPEELARPYDSPFGKTLGEYRRAVELTPEMFELIEQECAKWEIPWFASVLDWNSFVELSKLDSPIIKLPSTISNHRNYLLRVAKEYAGDLVISTGFTDASYEQFVLDNFLTNRNLFLLQCTSSYPTPPEACQISVVRHYDDLREKSYPNLYPGYSSHDIGSMGCMLSVAAGAKMVEKHVKLGNLDWIHFDGVAIDLYDKAFGQFVKDVRRAEIMCGKKHKQIQVSEHHKYQPNVNHN